MSATLSFSLFSFVGAIFMLFVTVLIKKQPFFIGMINQSEKAHTAARGAMWAYIVSFIISVVLTFRDAKKRHREAVIMRSTLGQVPNLNIPDYDVDQQDFQPSVNEGSYT
mmetsp:Transcript_33344/g.37923  ORF Transcript_33344/g.37923 Transcript_33344/m.37923 type:complete len:110 (+) Transcript_33344:68-397(+)|eukprot:CAMPEP_0194135612 /NCGR_PEP_ID=MMETSP0152-20130528/5714_1 /TAXON_ID=1049557 /ORGANISM="Thalassiothrix antarctica, Strain L6-D1" /LENGTH=109 /DNA_ID=CAMNT_0038831939 /DNA_START=45 /DNA_END=374 /DNA_ORIENTATION=-